MRLLRALERVGEIVLGLVVFFAAVSVLGAFAAGCWWFLVRGWEAVPPP